MRLRYFVLIAFFTTCAQSWAAPTPPEQPLSGPGGKSYLHSEVIKSVFKTGPQQFWIFEPAQPVPKTAPLIVFNHGWGGTNPRIYGAWIEHIVRRGNIVIFPTYQEPGKFRYHTEKVTGNAIRAVKEAIDLLNQRAKSGEHPKPDLDKFAIVGHSAGGQITANMAALAVESGLPIPKAIMPVQPGKSWSRIPKIQLRLENMTKIHPNTLMLTVVGDQDGIARDIDAKRIFYESTQVPLTNKDFIIQVSDDHGYPPLNATHFAPTAPNPQYDSGVEIKAPFLRWLLHRKMKQGRNVKHTNESKEDGYPDLESDELKLNALDYYGLWKLFDALCDTAFYGKNRPIALGGTTEQTSMGYWSDGAPVKSMISTDTP